MVVHALRPCQARASRSNSTNTTTVAACCMRRVSRACTDGMALEKLDGAASNPGLLTCTVHATQRRGCAACAKPYSSPTIMVTRVAIHHLVDRRPQRASRPQRFQRAQHVQRTPPSSARRGAAQATRAHGRFSCCRSTRPLRPRWRPSWTVRGCWRRARGPRRGACSGQTSAACPTCRPSSRRAAPRACLAPAWRSAKCSESVVVRRPCQDPDRCWP